MKQILFLSVFTAAAFIGQAQINFGIKAGANFTKFSGDDAKLEDISPKFRTGFAGGGLVNIGLGETFSVQPEVLYSMEGSVYKADGETATYKTDYINVPVLLQYNNPSGFYAETGPQVGFLMSAKGSYGGVSVDIKDSFKKINFSWGLGAGYKLSNGLGIGARYNLGLANIASNSDSEPGESSNVKLGGFHVGLFYTFGGSKE
jgi:hypothetical protein